MTLEKRFADLKNDIKKEEGPLISTVKNYPFAIFHYAPSEEFRMRAMLHELVNELRQKKWNVFVLSLLQILLDRMIENGGQDKINYLIKMEKMFYNQGNNFEKPLRYLFENLKQDIDTENGIASDIIQILETHIPENGRAIAFLTRLGSLYPFYKTSGLLKYLGNRVNVPVVLFYPGSKKGESGLSFMDEIEANPDYRPRVY